MPTTEEWAASIIFNTFHIILCILIIYYFIRFYWFRKSQALQKRYPALCFLQTLCIFFYVVQCILYKFAFIYDNRDTGYILKLLSEIFYVFSSHGVLLSFAARSYIIYFDINWASELQKSKWSVHLNSDLSSFWFLRHHSDFGSKRYIYSFVFIYYIAVSVLGSVLLETNMGIEGFIVFTLFAIEIITLFIIWNKIPKFHDVYLIKKEIRICNYLALTALLLYIIWVVKLAFIPYQLWSFMIFQFLFGTFVGLIAVVSNTYIFSEQNRHLIYGEEPLINAEQQTVGTIKDTLSSDDLLPLFFKHLSDEFSVEVLLAFVEFMEFSKVMGKDNDFMTALPNNNAVVTNIAQINDFKNEFVCPSELPASYIIFEKHQNVSDNIHQYLFIARDLFEKYITASSEFRINISYGCEEEIVEFVNSYCNDLYWSNESTFTLSELEKYRLFSLYYYASVEMYRLMLQSHRRFIKAIFSDNNFRVNTKENVPLIEHDSLVNDLPTLNSFSISEPSPTRKKFGRKKFGKKNIPKTLDDIAINMDGVVVDVLYDN